MIVKTAFACSCAVCAALSFSSCSKRGAEACPEPVTVRAVAVERGELADEVSGFGNLSYAKKVDIVASSDAVVVSLPFREGSRIRAGAVGAVLENKHLELARQRADSSVSQARAALDLARGRLREGEFSAEARVRGIAKSEAELAQTRIEYDEAARKLADQERLFSAGAVTEEAIREARFSLSASKYRIDQMVRSLEIDRIGLRDADLAAAGYGRPRTDDERLSSLIALSVSTLRAEVSAAEAQVSSALRDAESARLAFDELSVVSPSAGVVGARYVEEGERVKKEDKLLTVIDSSGLYAVFSARESDALRLSRGMPAAVRVDGANAEYRGTVDLVSPTADAQSGSFSVRVSLRDPSGRLKPGMFARASVRVGSPRKVPLIPDSALFDKKTENGREAGKVFEIVGGRIMERRVEIGELAAGGRVVLSGIEAGAPIVDRPDYTLREGDRVSVSD